VNDTVQPVSGHSAQVGLGQATCASWQPFNGNLTQSIVDQANAINNSTTSSGSDPASGTLTQATVDGVMYQFSTYTSGGQQNTDVVAYCPSAVTNASMQTQTQVSGLTTTGWIVILAGLGLGGIATYFYLKNKHEAASTPSHAHEGR
jgi:hypothetical protein